MSYNSSYWKRVSVTLLDRSGLFKNNCRIRNSLTIVLIPWLEGNTRQLNGGGVGGCSFKLSPQASPAHVPSLHWCLGLFLGRSPWLIVDYDQTTSSRVVIYFYDWCDSSIFDHATRHFQQRANLVKFNASGNASANSNLGMKLIFSRRVCLNWNWQSLRRRRIFLSNNHPAALYIVCACLQTAQENILEKYMYQFWQIHVTIYRNPCITLTNPAIQNYWMLKAAHIPFQ